MPLWIPLCVLLFLLQHRLVWEWYSFCVLLVKVLLLLYCIWYCSFASYHHILNHHNTPHTHSIGPTVIIWVSWLSRARISWGPLLLSISKKVVDAWWTWQRRWHTAVSARGIFRWAKGASPVLCSLFASVLFISSLLVHQLIVLVVF